MKITCETATLADAVEKAARVAPTKGSAFDRAMGIVLDVNRDADTALAVRASNLDSTYIQRVNCIEAEGEGSWRLPSAVLAGYVGSLPLHGSITLESEGTTVRVTAGKAEASLHTIPVESFPNFWFVDVDELGQVAGFAQRVNQVVFAAKRDGDPPLTGVHIDGEHLIACDTSRMASVPCVAPVDRPITVPFDGLAPAMRGASEIGIAAVGDRLVMQPDADTQATSIIYQPEYPSVSRLRGLVGTDWTAEVGASALADVLHRVMVLCKGDRYPQVQLIFRPGSVALDTVVPDLGWVREDISISGGPEVEVPFLFSPSLLTACCSAVSDGLLTINAGMDSMRPVLFSGTDGWSCVVMPRAPQPTLLGGDA